MAINPKPNLDKAPVKLGRSPVTGQFVLKPAPKGKRTAVILSALADKNGDDRACR